MKENLLRTLRTDSVKLKKNTHWKKSDSTYYWLQHEKIAVLRFYRKYVRCSAEYFKWIIVSVGIYTTNWLYASGFSSICETEHRIFKMEWLRWFEFITNWFSALIGRVFGLQWVFGPNVWDSAQNILKETLLLGLHLCKTDFGLRLTVFGLPWGYSQPIYETEQRIF